jgi:hypothetical protein
MNDSANMRALNMRRPGMMPMEEESMMPPELMQQTEMMMPQEGMNPMSPMNPMMEDDPNKVAGRVFTPGVGWRPGPRSA